MAEQRKPDYSHAIAFLNEDLDVVKTNEPLARRRGEIGQADLQRDEAKSIVAAMRKLGMRDKRNG